ncbi:MAG: helix-turn-helix domain-containing protein [Ruminococcus sp.]|nr:helix-turn-helix domain-containing protein [Ruminococcus sp.]
MIYKETLKNLREKNNLMQKEVAKIVELSNTQYCYYENETELMPIKHLNTLCNYFNVSFDYLFNFNNELNYKNSTKDINFILAGTRLKEIRKENKLTQAKLATILNTVQPVIAKYEKGINLIATPFLYTICYKYHISADYLLGKIDTLKYLKEQ